MPDMREEFEAWATNRCVSITKAPEAMMFFGGRRVPAGCYIMADTELAWEAWKASRAALRVVLPPTITAEEVVEHFNIDEEGIDMAVGIAHMVNGAIAACAAFIKKAGIEVKQNG